jgi:PhzF family phenazine biosynthesis protein
MYNYTLYHVNAFTTEVNKGNPAAICLFAEVNNLPADSDMQDIAREIGYSETCFICPVKGQERHYLLRWFTPKVEVKLCGHGTLATAFVL